MDQMDQCKQKISLLKKKIIEVGKLLTQCDEYKAENRQLKEKQAEYYAHLKKLYDQYVKLFAEKQQLETELALSREEASRALSRAQAAELDAERLQQLVRVYQNEREEYGVEKLDRSQKNVGRLVRFVMQSRKETTNGWAKPKPLPSWFHSILKSEMKRPNRCSAPSTPSLAWSTCSSPFPSSESGFDSVRSSPSHSSETPSPPLPPLFDLPVIEPVSALEDRTEVGDMAMAPRTRLNPANWVTQDPDKIPDSVTGEIFKLFHPFNVPLLSPIKSKPNGVKNRSKTQSDPSSDQFCTSEQTFCEGASCGLGGKGDNIFTSREQTTQLSKHVLSMTHYYDRRDRTNFFTHVIFPGYSANSMREGLRETSEVCSGDTRDGRDHDLPDSSAIFIAGTHYQSKPRTDGPNTGYQGKHSYSERNFTMV